MTKPITKANSPNPPNSTNLPNREEKATPATKSEPTVPPPTITERIVQRIKESGTNLKNYKVRYLVKDAEEFGPYLKQQRLETNQVRKFLDAVNRLKVKLAQLTQEEIDAINQLEAKLAQKDGEQKIKPEQIKAEIDELRFAKIKDEVLLLKPKLAYAAARQKAAKPMSDVMSAAIDKVHSTEDFERFVQLIESIIAYHKAEGGK